MVNHNKKMYISYMAYLLYGQFSLDKTADHISDPHCTKMIVKSQKMLTLKIREEKWGKKIENHSLAAKCAQISKCPS